MRRPLLLAAGAALISAVALAATDIPTKYAGSFPSDGVRKDIRGTLNGNRLKLTYVVGARAGRVGNYTCTTISPAQTRCPGTFRGDTDGKSGQQTVTITWSGGRPVATAFAGDADGK